MIGIVSAQVVDKNETLKCDSCVETISMHTIGKNDTLLCNVCIGTVTVIDQIMKANNLTLEIIEIVVEDLCELIGGKIIYQECQFIVKFIQYVYNMLSSGYSPEQICTYLDLCKEKYLIFE